MNTCPFHSDIECTRALCNSCEILTEVISKVNADDLSRVLSRYGNESYGLCD